MYVCIYIKYVDTGISVVLLNTRILCCECTYVWNIGITMAPSLSSYNVSHSEIMAHFRSQQWYYVAL